MDEDEQAEELTLETTGQRLSTRRRALWGVLAAGAVVVGALVVTSGGEDGMSPGLPVALGSSVADRESGTAADAMLAWVTYVPGDDLPSLGGEALAYRLATRVTEDQVRSLAGALGLDGDPVRDERGWTVRDGTRYLDVYDSGVGQWWFSASGGGIAVGSAGSSGGSAGEGTCGELSATGGVSARDCVDPAPPPDCAVSPDESTSCIDAEEPVPAVDLPSQDEARAIALDLLAATGVEVDDAAVAVEGPHDAWYVTLEPRIDGLPSGLVAAASVGSAGAIINASGYLADPERLGEYPLLDTRATIDRANAQSGVEAGGTTGRDATVATATVIDDVEGTADTTAPPCKVQADGAEICEATVPGVTCPQAGAPTTESVGAPETVECTPPVTDPGLEPEPLPADGPIEVVLVDATAVLVPLGAVDGSSDGYLVPGYRFTDEDGGRVDLPAVADSALTTPPTTDTTAPDPTEPPVTVTAPDPCAPLVEDDGSGTTHTVQPDPDCLVREPQRIAEGEEPQIGVRYYVDVQTGALAHCGFVSVELAGSWWWSDGLDGAGWAEPTEGGTLTLVAEDQAEFVGDAAATKVATLAPYEGPGERPLCE